MCAGLANENLRSMVVEELQRRKESIWKLHFAPFVSFEKPFTVGLRIGIDVTRQNKAKIRVESNESPVERFVVQRIQADTIGRIESLLFVYRPRNNVACNQQSGSDMGVIAQLELYDANTISWKARCPSRVFLVPVLSVFCRAFVPSVWSLFCNPRLIIASPIFSSSEPQSSNISCQMAASSLLWFFIPTRSIVGSMLAKLTIFSARALGVLPRLTARRFISGLR